MTYRAEEDLVLMTALDRLVEEAGQNRSRIEWFTAIAAAQRDVIEVVQARVEQAGRPWWRRWF